MHEVKHSSREARVPAGGAAAWKPEGRPAAVLLRWFATHWCNYRCPYCRQNHARRQPIDGHWAHCFDNWPVDRWLRAFKKAFSGPAVVVGDHRGRTAGGPRADGGTGQRADGHADRRVGYTGVRHWVRCSAGGLFSPTRCSAEGLKWSVIGVHDSDFQQIQGGQQIESLD
jgi:hypothetical protein